jgi:oligoribonuclease
MLAVFLDLETSGLDPERHRILELAFKIVDVHTGDVLCTYNKGIRQPSDVWDRRDLASVEFNGFTWEKNILGQDEESISLEIIQIFTDLKIQRGKAVFICQNPSFDRAFFSRLIDVYLQESYHWPYHWLDFASMYWALLMNKSGHDHPFPREINLSKNAIASHYGLPEETEPHCAINGVNHLILCYGTVIGFG